MTFLIKLTVERNIPTSIDINVDGLEDKCVVFCLGFACGCNKGVPHTKG